MNGPTQLHAALKFRYLTSTTRCSLRKFRPCFGAKETDVSKNGKKWTSNIMLTIALHGDLGNSKMMERDVGDLASSIDVFWDGRGWLKFNEQFERLMEYCRKLHEPPILMGYSRGGSVIAALSYMQVKIRAAVLYESPILDSAGVGGSFPVLMIWNDRGAKASIWGRRRREVESTESTWAATHSIATLEGKGKHMQVKPYPAHCWDSSLNDQIREWLKHA